LFDGSDASRGAGSEAEEPPRASAPELGCVVLAVGAPSHLAEAVASLLEQEPQPEVVVVNSGGGNAKRLLAGSGPELVVIEPPERLYPGAARNVGIAATAAPFIAFLAADTLAAPGWSVARLRAHRTGCPAVASAIVNATPRNFVAWAAHIALHARRMPGIPAELALRYGVSYDRRLFERFGLFREELRTGEDTEFNRRFASQLEIAWAPAVRTANRYPQRLGALLREQIARGRRAALAWRALAGPSPRAVAWNALARASGSVALAWRYAEAGERRRIAAASPLVPWAALAYAAGAASASRAPAAAFPAKAESSR